MLSVSATPIRKNERSFSDKRRLDADPGHAAAPGAEPQRPEATSDLDAQHALAWIERGMPESEIGYGPDAPRLTPEQLQEFKPASYVDKRSKTD